jgi:hypothetical protein
MLEAALLAGQVDYFDSFVYSPALDKKKVVKI